MSEFEDIQGWFTAIHHIVENRIRQAQKEGQFDNLPGKGKPLKLDDDSRIAPQLRASYRILKNAGLLPPEMQLRKEINELRELLNEVQCEEDARLLVREINEKILASNLMGGFSISSEKEQVYVEKIIERLKSRKARLHLQQREKESSYR
jgi:hypothetical protein